ncbi:uncharacterized protein LOC141620681 [Silene latifolia]|uniref:uncharacterized protein LOC141620681 n=1 Tax=Silene latifolia TaxID=37657 RepID=UPI003D77C141
MTSQPVQTNNEAYTEVGWYILDANQQQIGPYTISELREHYLNGYLPESTFVWSEGRSEWQQLSSVPELMAEVYGDKTQSLSSGHKEQSNVCPQETVSTYSESGTAPVSNDDEFEKWQNEVKKVEAEAELLKNGTASSQLEGFEHDRPSTPPEGEQEFIDDDGTLYKWDRSIRAWVPQAKVEENHNQKAAEPVIG